MEKVIQVPLVPVNEILSRYFCENAPNFLSLDVEGLDLDVLRGLDFDRYAPDVVCVETLSYDEHQATHKKRDTIDFMISKEYSMYADTRVNSIFCRPGLVGS